jgi:hypothetical protein
MDGSHIKLDAPELTQNDIKKLQESEAKMNANK